MKTKEALTITGYRSYEIGVFQEKDPKVPVLKKVIRDALIPLIEDGLKWILIGGNLGIELWAGQVVLELKQDYPEVQLAVIFPFEGWGENWKEPNQLLLSKVKAGADYVNSTSHQPYQNPSQLKNHTMFLLQKTKGCLIVYDEEFKGKPEYFLKDARKFQEKESYQVHQITMDDLENAIYFSESI